ncbi:MAG: sigma-54-dependent Fis family transcriptional regulator [Desulfobacteraceae bacterium]|nr:sigma-54-dependent Fis family transcriptional regulator [Desulfobacteraceae bacterium]
MPVKDKVIHAKTGHIAQILKRLELLATKDLLDSPVLFTGKTGSGKEMLADYLVEHILHKARKEFPYIKINCIGLPEEIIESELFGHEKGAFTGADKVHTGLIEKSDGGILFLDEIGVLPLPLQAKLLRVLEDREIRKVGSSKSKKINVRFIAATNRNLIPDLKHRFSYKINVPPLIDIPEEIPYFIEYFLRDSLFQKITIGTLLSMALMEWEGNVRELKHFLKEAEISLELIKQEFASSASNLITKEGLFDIVFLFEMVPLSLERYWTIRAVTNFDEMLLKDVAAVKKIKMNDFYTFHQARSIWRNREGRLSISLRRKAPNALEDELYLDLNESFSTTAKRLIENYVDTLDETTLKRLNSILHDPEGAVYLQKGLITGLRPKKMFFNQLKKPQPEIEPPDLFELPWPQAKENFNKAYWERIHSDNPKLNQKQMSERMGISQTTYHKMKHKFNEKALETDKN